MDAEACQKALGDALRRECKTEYRKSMNDLYGLIKSGCNVAIGNSAKLAKYHDSIGNEKPSKMNPGTRMADIFTEIGPYLEGEIVSQKIEGGAV